MKNKLHPKISPNLLYALLAGAGVFFVSLILALILLNMAYLDDTVTDNLPPEVSVNNNPLTDNLNQTSLVTSPINNFDIDYDIPRAPLKANTIRLPVLTYHQVANLPNNNSRDYYVSPKVFEEQMKYLVEKGYKTLTPKEFYDIMQTGKNPLQKSVMLTFDDGNNNNYTNAYPILAKYGLVGVFYVPSYKRGINNAQLKEMSGNGMVIDPHGKTHMMLGKVTNPGTLYDELTVSKASIESITGKTSVSFCYPGCEYNGSVTSTLAADGYLLGFTCGENADHKIGNRFSLTRMHVYNDMQHFKTILSGTWYYPGGYSN